VLQVRSHALAIRAEHLDGQLAAVLAANRIDLVVGVFQQDDDEVGVNRKKK
jgi:hypothetical protein